MMLVTCFGIADTISDTIFGVIFCLWDVHVFILDTLIIRLVYVVTQGGIHNASARLNQSCNSNGHDGGACMTQGNIEHIEHMSNACNCHM